MPAPVQTPPATGVGRRHERVGAVVDVEHRGLGALEEHGLAAVERLVEQQRGVGDHRPQPLGVRQELLDDRVDRRPRAGCRPWRAAGSSGRGWPRPCRAGSSRRRGRRSGCRRGRPCRRTPARCRGRWCRPCSCRGSARSPCRSSVWYDAITWALALTTSRDTSTPRAASASSSRNSASGETTTPLPITDGGAGGEDAAGQQVGGELLAVHHDGVPGVVAAAGADDVVDRLGRSEEVGGLALALVTPLGAEDDDRGHRTSASSRRRTGPARAFGAGQGRVRSRPYPRGRPGRVGPWARVRPVDPLLVITNGDAGTADDDALEPPLALLRERVLGRGPVHVQPGRARRRAATGRLAADRGRGRRRQPARGDRGALPPPRPGRRGRRAAADGHRQRLRPHPRHPARPRGGGADHRRRRGPPDGPDRRRARRDRGQQRPRRRRRPGEPRGAPAGRTGSARSASGGPTSASSATRSAPRSRRSIRPSVHMHVEVDGESSPTSTGRC